MVKRKLKGLKRSEENKILKEHEGLYSQLVSENYAKPAPKKKIDKRYIWIPSLASAFAIFLCVVGVWASSLAINFNNEKGDFTANNAASNDDVPDGVVGEDLPAEQIVTIDAVEAMLESSSLSDSGLKFSQITAQSQSKGSVVELEVDTVHTLKLAVSIDGGAVADEFLPSGKVQSTVNEHGFLVEYAISRRRMEDYYTYKTTASVYTKNEVYYIRYNYSSSSSECELLQVISACITPKA